jgi:uncharacterized protein (TIGR03086 family)
LSASAASALALLDRALDQTGAVIGRVTPAQAGLPTPCRSWDVRTLVNHVVDEVNQFVLVTAGAPRRAVEPDALGVDWAVSYAAAAEGLRAAWRQPGVLERTVQLPMGEVPAAWTIHQQLTELAMHAWDVAVSTGQSTAVLDAEIAEASLAWGHENLLPEYRGDESSGAHIGPEVEVATDAPVYERLAAFGGRTRP